MLSEREIIFHKMDEISGLSPGGVYPEMNDPALTLWGLIPMTPTKFPSL